jgi:hypothetical protein
MKLRYTKPNPPPRLVVGDHILTLAPDGTTEVDDQAAEAVMRKVPAFVPHTPDAPKPKPALQSTREREDLGPLRRVVVEPTHRSRAGFVVQDQVYHHDAQGLMEVPATIAERWIKVGIAKRYDPASAAPPKAEQPATHPKMEPPKAEQAPKGRGRGRREEEPAPPSAPMEKPAPPKVEQPAPPIEAPPVAQKEPEAAEAQADPQEGAEPAQEPAESPTA